MLRSGFILGMLILFTNLSAQTLDVNKLKPDSSSYENIYVKKVSEDSNHSSYVIWVKHQVPTHYHESHTELLFVVDGEGTMTIGERSFKIAKNDYFVIPKGSHHSVITTSKKPLKVISVQTPIFNGDRIFVK